MRIRALCLVLLAAAVAAPSLVQAAGPWLLSPGEYYSDFQAGRTSTDTYYDDSGTHLTSPTTVERRALTFYDEIGWKKSMSWVLSAPYASVTGRQGQTSETQTGFADLNIGLRYRLQHGKTASALQLDWIGPMGYDSEGVPPLGDGLQTVGLTFHAGQSLGSDAFWQGAFGYDKRWQGKMSGQESKTIPDGSGNQVPNPNYQALSYQNQLHWSALAGWWVGSSLLLTGHYLGYNTSAHGDASPDASNQIAGPEIRYRVDDRLDLYVGSDHSLSGKSVRSTDTYYVGMAFRVTKLNRVQGLLGNKRRP